MSVRNAKEKIIKEIMNLRGLIGEFETNTVNTNLLVTFQQKRNSNKKEEALRHLNKIQDKVFNI